MDAGRTYTLCGTLDYKATFALELMNFVETMMNVALKMMESDGKIICCISFDEFCTGTLDYMAPEVLQNKVSKSDELCVKNDRIIGAAESGRLLKMMNSVFKMMNSVIEILLSK